eukprot:TRINITY_DN1869_c0_g1_i3.p3 TRINITY_DN1869_c0_g1~~TRINITY_DN1869_c0_g1_i3.p3  ORF type:complete len:148 (+),score=57.63 TRINITY_DN1869_c0_g1_i3:80-523(+)
MAFRSSGALLMRQTAPCLAGHNPYFHFPRDVTRTVLRENWKFSGKLWMKSFREQYEYRNRNLSYGNVSIWWQSHWDVVFHSLPIAVSIVALLTLISWFPTKASGNMGPTWLGWQKFIFSLGTRGWEPGPVWFEEEARQKKIGLFAED